MIDNDTAREIALALPEAEEHDHFGRPSFRMRSNSKIFMTLWPNERRAVLKFTLADQMALTSLDPAFSPVPGAWGEKGWTNVDLNAVAPDHFADALETAWRTVAPKRLLKANLK
jgi:hypothetical protein